MAFVYEAEEDRYWCPMGKCLAFAGMQKQSRRKGSVLCRTYRCRACSGCALAERCVGKKAQARVLWRDAHEPLREAMDERMRTPGGRAVYRRRKWMAESPLGVLKSVMGLRQFYLRGLAKVRSEWLWACTAFNLKKMVKVLSARRRACTALPV